MNARAWLFVAFVPLAVGCVAGESVDPAVPASVARLSADSQAVVVGGRASAPLQVRVLGGTGAPLAGVTVDWAATGGSVAPLSAVTDADGVASTTYYSGATAGTATVVASADAVTASYTMRLVNEPTGALATQAGNGTAVLPGMAVTVTVRAADRFGNPVPGVAVTFETDGGTLSASSGTTDASGLASVVLTTTSVSAVQYRVRASASTFGAATFVISAI